MYSEHYQSYHYFRKWSVPSSGRGCSQEAERAGIRRTCLLGVESPEAVSPWPVSLIRYVNLLLTCAYHGTGYFEIVYAGE
jgi:hypothetical protein